MAVLIVNVVNMNIHNRTLKFSNRFDCLGLKFKFNHAKELVCQFWLILPVYNVEIGFYPIILFLKSQSR